MALDLTILYEQDEEGWWVAEIPEVPGVFAQGRTPEEARANVFEVLDLVSESRREEATRRSVPPRSETLHLAVA